MRAVTGDDGGFRPTAARPRAIRPRAVLVVLVAALLIRAVYALFLADTACLAINDDPITDMEAFHTWASRIAAGDWLGRVDFHPYHPWQRAIGSEAEWLDWYGPHVFHQDPLYPYALAVVYLVAPATAWTVALIQMLLGALTAAGICLLAGRMLGARAGIAAGLLAAFYGPFLFYESLRLRDTLLVSLTTAFLLLIEEARRRRSASWWAAAGAAAGAVYLTKPNVIAFIPLLAAWIFLSRSVPRPGRAAAALLGGMALAIAPAVARNVAVGAPPLKTTTRGAIEFINGNNPYHPGTGWFDGDDARVTAYARDTLRVTRAKLLPTIRVVLDSWRGRMGQLAALQIKKLGFLLAPFEMPNNASYGYFRENSPVLGAGLPTFLVVSPLAALGLLVSARRWRALMPHYIFLAVGAATTVAFYVIARFRIPYMPLVLAFAGAGAAGLAEMAASRRWRQLAAAAGLAGLLLAVNAAFNYPDDDLVRPQDFWVSSRTYASRGETGRALREIEAGLRLFPEMATLWIQSAEVREAMGDPGAALQDWRRARALDPESPRIRRAIERLEPADSEP